MVRRRILLGGGAAAVAAFSPAVSPGDDVFAATAELRNVPIGLWCGDQDGFSDDVHALAEALPPSAGSFGAGAHNFGYWSRCLPAAFDFLGRALTPV
jgi:S-formylglutathione hydrolase FrmB